MRDPTSDWYSSNAAAFCERTFAIDMDHVHRRFLRYMPLRGRILDVGCGSGRDSRRFVELGYSVDARDRSQEIAEEARRLTGLTVRVEDVLQLEDRDSFDGVWACAMLIHLRDHEFDEAIFRLTRALRLGGVLYISLKQSERRNPSDARDFHLWIPEEASRRIHSFGRLQPLEAWSTEEGPPKETRWINLISRRTSV